eukprot:CAMPEP_0203958916 /NCGR_PEP_ID=MMETSP0359-20131031/90185_1 /ASSEMBLY_ACC=CAM_ASM_000338 /TAXON_ID=268821 /ORGANISM="Scrippsiella Hangoei, Strain SHTV-5" /LENGTH=64 /DNA_ID=CAMNT_0050892935 /DNA_START=35 /DNA_END=225 /DNA_ORIENTATION=-
MTWNSKLSDGLLQQQTWKIANGTQSRATHAIETKVQTLPEKHGGPRPSSLSQRASSLSHPEGSR